MIDWLEIKLCQLLIWKIKRDYGPKCKTKDLEDFPNGEMGGSRCPICEAWEVIEWLEKHIEIIKY